MWSDTDACRRWTVAATAIADAAAAAHSSDLYLLGAQLDPLPRLSLASPEAIPPDLLCHPGTLDVFFPDISLTDVEDSIAHMAKALCTRTSGDGIHTGTLPLDVASAHAAACMIWVHRTERSLLEEPSLDTPCTCDVTSSDGRVNCFSSHTDNNAVAMTLRRNRTFARRHRRHMARVQRLQTRRDWYEERAATENPALFRGDVMRAAFSPEYEAVTRRECLRLDLERAILRKRMSTGRLALPQVSKSVATAAEDIIQNIPTTWEDEVHATTQVDDDSIVPIVSKADLTVSAEHGVRHNTRAPTYSGMMDGGANIGLCPSKLESLLEGVEDIKRIPLGTAVTGGPPQYITRRGYLPLMSERGVIRVPMYLHPSASGLILSPEAIMFSHPDIDQWTQRGQRDGQGSIVFSTTDGQEILTLRLRKHNQLYFYDFASAPTASYQVDLPSAALASVVRTMSTEIDPVCHQVDAPVGGASANPDEAAPTLSDDEASTTMGEEEKSKPSPPPRPTHARRPPVTPAQQLEAEKWSARLGFPGEYGMTRLARYATGLPNEFHFHPFRHISHKEAARIRREAAGRNPAKAVKIGQRFFMDFGFIRSSTGDFQRPSDKTDRLVKSFDGFSSYLLVIDEVSRYAWVFLCQSKEPPVDYVSEFLLTHGLKDGGVIRCDQGGELARSNMFREVMLKQHHYKVEPTGADSPSQNGGVERVNDTLAVLVRTLLYGSELHAKYWSAALVHAVYLYNRRFHSTTRCTPYEAWHGNQPDLSRVRMFGARVCVKRTGKRRAKLDRHDFQGIFIGYSATDQNIRYIDLSTGLVKTCHHAVFDEAWYLYPTRPPAAQLLYDLGLRAEQPPTPPSMMTAEDLASPWPPLALDKPLHKEIHTPRAVHLPLRESDDLGGRPAAAAAAHLHGTSSYEGTSIKSAHDTTAVGRDSTAVTEFDITRRDLEQIYLSPSPYEDSFEEEIDLRRWTASTHPTAGMDFKDVNGRLIITTMTPGTPSHRIPRWKSRLRHAWLINIDGQPVSTVEQVQQLLAMLTSQGNSSCRLLFAKSHFAHGLTNQGIPQVNIDQLNPRMSFDHDSPSVQTGIPDTVNTVWDAPGGVNHWSHACTYKLTRSKLIKGDDWVEWQQSEFAQLDQYEAQGMFGTPVTGHTDLSIFSLVWSYAVKELDKRKKARCTCDGSPRSQVKVLDHTYANCVDHNSARLFYAITAMENLTVYGADVTNAFGEAAPPKQGFFIRPDDAVRAWWKARKGEDLPRGQVIPVLAAMQGHPEAPRLWEKHADTILRRCGLIPTTHEPCLYSGLVQGERVLFMRQVDDFAVAAPSQRTANILFDMIDDALTFPLKRMGLVTLFNGVDVCQTKHYVKLSVETYIDKFLPKYFTDPVNLRVDTFGQNRPTPLPSRDSFMRDFLSAKGDPDMQEELAKRMGFSYRAAIGELIYAMVTCRPDLSYAVVRASQSSACPAEIHFNGIKHMLKYLHTTKSDGIYFWRSRPNDNLPVGTIPDINSNMHDLLLDGRPKDAIDQLVGYVDADWATCPNTRRSFTGVCIRLAGGTVAYKSRLQPTVAQSSTEAEFMGANDAGKIILFIRSVLWDLGIPQTAATLLYEDNDACTAMANAQKPTPRTRHMDIKYHVLCEWVERDLLKLIRIHTSLNMADHFTKALGPALFHRHVDYILGHVPPTYSPEGRRLLGQHVQPSHDLNHGVHTLNTIWGLD